MQSSTPVAFPVDDWRAPALVVRVNFGILAGRDATPAEIGSLGRELLEFVPEVTVVAEQHYSMGREHEAVVHLVKIEIEGERPNQWLTDKLVAAAAAWARACAAERHAEV